MDFTSLWASWQKYHNYVGAFVAGALLFTLGWQVGHMMSPYYAATPIVFEEKVGEDHGGTLEGLQQLEQAGIKATKAPVVQASPGTVAGAATTSGAYVASKNSTLYHDKRCPSASRIASQNLLTFSTKEQAEAAGFTPSACTKTYLGQN